MYCYRSCYCCCYCSCYCQGLALSCVCAPMVSRSHAFIFSYCRTVIFSCSDTPVLSCRHALLLSCSQGLALSCVCAPMVSRSHVFILSSSHALMLSFSRAIMMLSVCRLYRKYRRIIVRNQNASPSATPTSARSAQVRPSHDVMLSRLRALEPSCSRTLMLS